MTDSHSPNPIDAKLAEWWPCEKEHYVDGLPSARVLCGGIGSQWECDSCSTRARVGEFLGEVLGPLAGCWDTEWSCIDRDWTSLPFQEWQDQVAALITFARARTHAKGKET